MPRENKKTRLLQPMTVIALKARADEMMRDEGLTRCAALEAASSRAGFQDWNRARAALIAGRGPTVLRLRGTTGAGKSMAALSLLRDRIRAGAAPLIITVNRQPVLEEVPSPALRALPDWHFSPVKATEEFAAALDWAEQTVRPGAAVLLDLSQFVAPVPDSFLARFLVADSVIITEMAPPLREPAREGGRIAPDEDGVLIMDHRTPGVGFTPEGQARRFQWFNRRLSEASWDPWPFVGTLLARAAAEAGVRLTDKDACARMLATRGDAVTTVLHNIPIRSGDPLRDLEAARHGFILSNTGG